MAFIIQITWTPVTGGGLTGYNVYLVTGSPPSQTRTLLAFVAGISSSSYNYTGVEGQQYQFEVRATDGVNEGPPLEIFYPNGTTLYTPTLITPTGQPMLISRDVPYVTKEEFIQFPTGLKLTNTSTIYTSGVLSTYLSLASEMVNRYARRHFNVQTIDEVYHGIRIGQDMPKLITVPLNEGPIQNIVRIDIQVLRWFVNFSLDYLQVFPEMNFIQIVPFLGGNQSGIPLPSAALLQGLLGKVWTRYTYGYDVIPNSIKLATILLTTKMIALQENPVSATQVRFGRNFQLQWDKDQDPLLNQVKNLLDPYRISTFRRP